MNLCEKLPSKSRRPTSRFSSKPLVDAAALNGLAPKLAADMFLETLIGTSHLIAKKDFDTLGVRRAVASPGESTVRGVAALERCGIRPMLQEAMKDVLTRLFRSLITGEEHWRSQTASWANIQ